MRYIIIFASIALNCYLSHLLYYTATSDLNARLQASENQGAYRSCQGRLESAWRGLRHARYALKQAHDTIAAYDATAPQEPKMSPSPTPFVSLVSPGN